MSSQINPTISGILVIDKPRGWTSFDVVAKIRGLLKVNKVGHAGTLDPMATGVLVVLVGAATKLSDQLLSEDKLYQATVSFGQQTSTGDADGQVIDTDDATNLTETEVKTALKSLVGTREQQVPAYSAVKVGGKKLYELARAGKIEVIEQLPSRTITIHSIELNNFDATPPFPTADITVNCTKGTYIRVLAEEIAEKLGTVAHLTTLRRLASGKFTIDQATTIEQLISHPNPSELVRAIDKIEK